MKLFLFLLYAFLGVGYMYRGMKGDDKYYAYLSLIWMFLAVHPFISGCLI